MKDLAVNDTKVIITDIDGTIITNGEIDSSPESLREFINAARKRGVLFTLASGRDLHSEKKVRKELIGQNSLFGYEACIYEEAHVLLGSGKYYRPKGLDAKTMQAIKYLYKTNSMIFKGLVPPPGVRYTTKTGWVTSEFARNKQTNERVLEERYLAIKDYIESRFQGVEVKRSADAIDVVSKGLDKVIAFERYLGFLKKARINSKEVFVIGDSENDIKMISRCLELGGRAGFVGKKRYLVDKFLYTNRCYISRRTGPLGTLELLRKYV